MNENLRFRFAVVLLCMLMPSLTSAAAWFDNAWPYRRALDVIWDAERAGGSELAMAEFYTAGHHKPNGEDIRVATDDGTLVPSRALMIGPGDRIRVVFALRKGQRKYFAYFGHANPPAPPAGKGDVAYECGLLMETRQLAGGSVDSAQQLEAAWNRSTAVIGRTMLREPFLGLNPFIDQARAISKLTGSLYVVQPGEYLFAAAADDRGALFIDGKPVVYAPQLVGDSRFNAKVTLAPGRHDFVFYHANIGGDSRFSVAWQRPDMGTVGVVNKEALGVVSYAIPGAMEEIRKTLTADFKVDYLGESYAAGHYTHRVRFTANPPKAAGAVAYEWDLGDGQCASGADVEHVYLADGVYPVRLTARIGANRDTQTMQAVIGRPLMQMAIANEAGPPGDEPAVHSRIVKSYTLDKLPMSWLLPAAMLHLRAGQVDSALVAAKSLAGRDRQANPEIALAALRELADEALEGEKLDEVLAMWGAAPAGSNLQPHASIEAARLLVWWKADFPAALERLRPHLTKDDAVARRLAGQAMILNGQVEPGAKLLAELPVGGEPAKRVALSGALARSIEFFIAQKDWREGEKQWERWQALYPADFMEGYGVLLKVRLIEARNAPEPAARIAAAFAKAVPGSSYAPQLLDMASRLLKGIDDAASQALRDNLRKRYPEDPLSQQP